MLELHLTSEHLYDGCVFLDLTPSQLCRHILTYISYILNICCIYSCSSCYGKLYRSSCFGYFAVLIICWQQSVLLFDKHGVHFPFPTVKDFRFTLLNSILIPPVMPFDFYEMLVLEFVKISPLMLNLF